MLYFVTLFFWNSLRLRDWDLLESPTAQVALPQGVSFDAEQQRYTVGAEITEWRTYGKFTQVFGLWLIDVLNVFVIYWYVTLDIIATYCKIYVLMLI